MSPILSKLSRRARSYLATVTILFLITALAIVLNKPDITESSATLEPNESVSINSSGALLSTGIYDFNFQIPLDTPNSKLLEIGSEKEAISIFKLEERVYVFFIGAGKGDKQFVTDPVGIPLDSDEQNYTFSIVLNDSKGTLKLNSSAMDVAWKVPSAVGFTNFEVIESGNAPEINYQLTQNTGINKTPLYLWLVTVLAIAFLGILRKQIFTLLRGTSRTRELAKLATLRNAIALLAIGLIGLAFLPPAPPAGLLTSGDIDLTKISTSDLVLENEELDGGWIFRNSPNVKYPSVDYSSNFKFELDINLDAETKYTEILAYGVPSGKESSPKDSHNFEISMNAKQGIYFKIPNKDSRGNFYSKKLTKGDHKLSGEVRNGREFEFQVDGILVYAMSSQEPIYLPIEPNLFVSKYVLDNAKSGRVTWQVGAEAATPVKYGLYRIQSFAVVVAIFSSLVVFGVRIFRREKIKPFFETNSRKVLRSSFFTFIALSGLGCTAWFMALQPVASITQPRNYPLFLTQYRFSDFYQIFLSSQNKDPYSIAEVIYPPFGMLALDLVGFISARHGLILVMTASLALIASLFLFILNNRTDLSRLEKTGIFAVTALSFPVVFALDRGNLDLVVSALLLTAIWLGSKQGKGNAVGVLIGFASAIKIYPLFLLPIFYYQKREIRTVVTSIFTFLLLSVVGAVHYQMGPLQFLRSVLLGSSGQELSAEDALRWNGSFAALITTGTNLISPTYTAEVWQAMSSTILLIAILVISAGIALFLAKKKVDVTSFAIVWLSLVSLAFPVTGAYRFTIFLIAFALLLFHGIQRYTYLTPLGFSLGVVASPVVYWFFDDGAVSTYSLIVPLATVSQIFLIVNEALKRKKEAEF